MLKIIHRLGALAMLVILHNIDNSIDLFGLGSLLTDAIRSAPRWAALLNQVVLSKWVLALSTLVVGMCLADWVLRRSLRFEIEPGRWPLKWIEHRRRSILSALRHPKTIGRLIDVRIELATLDKALTSTHVGLPSVPCLDPDQQEIERTILYLKIIEPITPEHLEISRKNARTMLGLSKGDEIHERRVDARKGRLRSALYELLRR